MKPILVINAAMHSEEEIKALRNKMISIFGSSYEVLVFDHNVSITSSENNITYLKINGI